jgi:hypothetical protein
MMKSGLRENCSNGCNIATGSAWARKMLRSMMKAKNFSSLEEMIALVRDLVVRMVGGEMSQFI